MSQWLKRWFVPLAILTVVIAITVVLVRRIGPTPESSRPLTTVKIGYQETALYRHLFVAKDKGFFANEGVNAELVPFTSANQMMFALVAGQIDAAGLTNLEVALKVESEDPNQFELANFLVWTAQAYPDYLLDCTRDKGLHKVSELKGRVLGRHPGTAVAGFATAVLKDAGLDPKQVRQEELQPNLMGDAVRAHRVDALYAMDPAATRLVQAGACDILLRNPLGTVVKPPIPISGTALSERLLQRDPNAARAIVRALDRAILYLRQSASDEEVAQIIARYTRIKAEEAQTMNRSVYWTSGEIDAARVQSVADQFRTLGITKAPSQVQTMILPAPRAN
jgi:NitT/TauT family transport system substrate-binding protein